MPEKCYLPLPQLSLCGFGTIYRQASHFTLVPVSWENNDCA